MTTLTATRTVMGLESAMSIKAEGLPAAVVGAVFRSERGHVLTVAHDVWADMGEPAEITVTIEPGDQLNRPPAGVDPDQAEADMIAGFRGDAGA